MLSGTMLERPLLQPSPQTTKSQSAIFQDPQVISRYIWVWKAMLYSVHWDKATDQYSHELTNVSLFCDYRGKTDLRLCQQPCKSVSPRGRQLHVPLYRANGVSADFLSGGQWLINRKNTHFLKDAIKLIDREGGKKEEISYLWRGVEWKICGGLALELIFLIHVILFFQ